MKTTANTVLGSIVSVILLFMIYWMVNIQTKYEYPDVTDKVVEAREMALSIERGMSLFQKEDCSICHKPSKLQTPSSMKLINISQIRDRKWLFQFIRNEESLLQNEDSIVLALKELYNWSNGKHDKKHLTDQELTDILNYLDSFN
jgi:cytochrome c1